MANVHIGSELRRENIFALPSESSETDDTPPSYAARTQEPPPMARDDRPDHACEWTEGNQEDDPVTRDGA